MIDGLLDFFFRAILPGLLCWPGAYFKWTILGRKGNFKSYFRASNRYSDAFVGILILAVPIVIIWAITRLF